MTCTKCGVNCPENSVFCPNCGSSLSAVLDVIKKVFSSRLFLVLLFSMTAQMILSLLDFFVNGGPSADSSLLNKLFSLSQILLPSLFTVLGLCFLYFYSKIRPSKEKLLTGLSFVKAGLIIHLVFSVISLFLVGLLLFSASQVGSFFSAILHDPVSNGGVAAFLWAFVSSGFLLIYLLFLSFLFVFSIVYIIYLSMAMRTAQKIRTTVKTGIPSKASAFVAVFSFILAPLMGILFLLLNSLTFLSLFSLIFYIITHISLSVLFFSYNKKIKPFLLYSSMRFHSPK